MLAINIITILILGLIVYQDIKDREIYWILLLLLFISLVIYGMLNVSLMIFLKICVSNLLFLIVQISLLAGFYLLKGVSYKSVFTNYLGSGDLILFTSITFAFSKLNFIVFYLTGLVFSLLLWLFIRKISVQIKDQVPLAGLMSLYLILIILIGLLFKQPERFNDNFLFQLIYG
jgi:hypothetical protein